MFADEILDGADYPSSWKEERCLESSQTQTLDITYSESSIQTKNKRDQESQTYPETPTQFELLEDNSPKLVDFLKRMEPMVCKALEQNTRSHAFDGYDANWEEDGNIIKCLHVLGHKDLGEKLQCTQLSWNQTGSTLAVAYGRMDHQDWCTHKGALCTWNMDRRDISTTKADVLVDVPSCLMCVAFHPKKTAWIAGGSFNGQVYVWDMSREDEALLASTGVSDDTHREPVTQIVWLQDTDRWPNKYVLVSTGNDGRILVWEINESRKLLELKEGFMLLANSLPSGFGGGGGSQNRRAENKEMGVGSISYVRDDLSHFVIGSESGGIFKCSMNARGSVPTSEILPSVPLFSPVTFAFEPQNGPVHSVDCSPFHRNLFLACGIDTSVRLYSMLESRHILSVEPGCGYLFSAQWSPVRPLVFAVTSGQGKLLIYDLKKSRTLPVQSLLASPEGKEVFGFQFNHNQKQLLATCDADGIVMIWQLSDELISQGARETESLLEFANNAILD